MGHVFEKGYQNNSYRILKDARIEFIHASQGKDPNSSLLVMMMMMMMMKRQPMLVASDMIKRPALTCLCV